MRNILPVLCTLLVLLCPSATTAGQERLNVLFIAVDDLNHWVGHLGRNPQARTPNLDRLASMGMTFTNAHCAAPVCNPSRTALLSGLRPGSSGIYDNGTSFQLAVTSEQSLVTQYRNAGYETLGMGKLWHGGLGFADQWTATGGKERADRPGDLLDNRSIGGIAFGVLKGGDELVPDTAIADYGISELQKQHERPFFLTLGFHKPHMPWNVPQKYYDLHPLDSIQLPPTRTDDLSDVPTAGIKMAAPDKDHAEILRSGRWKEAVQAYLAAISYLDAQVGRVLDALEKSAYRSNTIICLWGDHGWHLGEKQHWRKFALWEEATRAPLIWVVPGTTKPGSACSRPVDFMSVYPTLCELSGLPKPAHVEGTSLAGLLKNPNSEWSHAAVTTFGLNNHAVRTDHWRYIRYADGSEELYDHRNDPYEWTNLAAKPETADQRQQLAAFLPTRNVPDAEQNKPASDRKAGTKAKAAAKRKAGSKNTAPQPETDPSPDGKVAPPDNTVTSRPNVVWLIVEDMSADFSCYGQQDIRTPNVDRLAAEGTRFSKAFVTAPICSICRSALITGRYQTSIGAQNHRSNVPAHPIRLPDGVQLIPQLLRQAGYHASNITPEEFLRSPEDAAANPSVSIAKTDYNFQWDQTATYDRTHWTQRPAGSPFFVQVQLHGGKHRGQGNEAAWPKKAASILGSVTPQSQLHLPAWLPDDPVMREDWAQYLDTVRWTDREVGLILDRLQAAGELDRTVIFFMTDHGISHVRCKQFLYDSGTHVPLIVRGPGIAHGRVRDDVVEHIDLAASTLGLAGISKPDWVLARDILAPDYTPRQFVFAARDRADETVDLIRSVRDTRFKYIWNGFPSRPYLQPNRYKDSKPILQAMRRLHTEGKLNPEQSLIMADTRPVEELYDTTADPWEFLNLATDPAYQTQLKQMRAALRDWQKRTGDPCQPEPKDIYLAEVWAAAGGTGKRVNADVYARNVELMLQWMQQRPPLPGPPPN